MFPAITYLFAAFSCPILAGILLFQRLLARLGIYSIGDARFNMHIYCFSSLLIMISSLHVPNSRDPIYTGIRSDAKMLTLMMGKGDACGQTHRVTNMQL